MFRLLASGIALVGLMVLTAVFAQSAGTEPALTRADSVLPPPPAHLFVNAAEARFIRWDCSDWQPYPAVADAEDELASAILETLAANRGKTLYCGLDQSDTWTKRQVYDHAHMHNDRDRTQYDGSQGQGRFRGFTAGQEGWLTDGEHGITGVSPERIFEFPQEERGRRRWRTIKVDISSQSADAGYCPDNGNPGSASGQAFVEGVTTRGNLICTNYGRRIPSYLGDDVSGQHQARNRYARNGGSGGSNDWKFDWRTRAKTGNGGPAAASGNTLTEAGWIAKAETAAIAACKAKGGKYVKGSADFGMGHNRDSGVGGDPLFYKGPGHGWFYAKAGHSVLSLRNSQFYYKARESRTWSATCTKRVRGSRRR